MRVDRAKVTRSARRIGRRVRSGPQKIGRLIEQRVDSPLQILMYHRIATAVHDPWDLAVPSKTFARQLVELRKTGTIVDLQGELRAVVRGRTIGRHRRFALTFDDGYACNYLEALPILERLDAPATFFVATGFLDQPSYWWDRLARLAFDDAVTVESIVARWNDEFSESFSNIAEPPNRHELNDALWRQLVTHPPDAITAVLDRLCENLCTDAHHGDGRPLTRSELAMFADHPLVTIGGHTVGHRVLAQLDPETCFAELKQGRAELNELLGIEPTILAYPFGSANQMVADAARRAGFEFAVTTEGRTVSRFDNRYFLPRLLPPDVAASSD